MYDTSNELCFLMPCVFLLVYALLSHLSSDHEFSMANLGIVGIRLRHPKVKPRLLHLLSTTVHDIKQAAYLAVRKLYYHSTSAL